MLRGSSVTGATRWLTRSSSIRTAARANAACAAAASPWRISAAMLSGASSVTAGAPARGRGDDVGDCRQRLVLDDHAVDRVARRLARSRRRPRPPARRRSARPRAPARGAAADGRAAVGAAEVGRGRHRLQAGGDQLGAGVDGEHARHRARRLGIDGDDARVRVRRALEGDDRLPRLGQVVDEAAAPGEQLAVLDAVDGAAAAEARRGLAGAFVARHHAATRPHRLVALGGPDARIAWPVASS